MRIAIEFVILGKEKNAIRIYGFFTNHLYWWMKKMTILIDTWKGLTDQRTIKIFNTKYLLNLICVYVDFLELQIVASSFPHY